MARRTRILTDVAKVAEEPAIDASPGGTAQYANLEGGRREAAASPSVRGSLPQAGRSKYRPDRGADGRRPDTVRKLINRTLATAENRAAEEMRELENSRLDRAQAAIWSNVLAGDYRDAMVFLEISARRARLNGLDSPASEPVDDVGD